MILNEPVETVMGECIIYGAPNEEITLKNIVNEQTYKCTLDSNGEYIYGSFYYGIYIISGSISKKVYPEGRLVFFDLFSETVFKNEKQYRIISAYPEKTWFWFGREFGTWKCSQDTPGSVPFTDKSFTYICICPCYKNIHILCYYY